MELDKNEAARGAGEFDKLDVKLDWTGLELDLPPKIEPAGANPDLAEGQMGAKEYPWPGVCGPADEYLKSNRG